MKNLTKVLAVAAAISLAAAAEARADFSFPAPGICGGNNFATCAAVTLSTAGNPSVVTLDVTNLGTNGEIYKTVGLINIPADVTVTITAAPAGYTPFDEDPDINIAGYNDFGSGANNPQNGLANGQSGQWQFTFSRELTAQEIAALGVGIHGISGPNGCSTQFGVLAGGAVNNVDEEAYARCGETTIPEPITMTLLATGLAGMGGAGFVRRRNKKTVA